MWKENRKLLLLAILLLILNMLAGYQVYIKTVLPKAAPALAAAAAKEQPGKVALTFDDGPSKRYTPQLLDGLAERRVKATFFITGKNAAANPEIVKRIAKEGHLIGNHTYSHLQLSRTNREVFKQELVKTCSIIKEITGEDVLYVRPPYGSWDKTLEKELNLFPVLWTIDPLDWCTDNAANVVQKVVSKTTENSVILLHDEYASSVTAALQIVDELQKQGYEFVTVEEILFD